MIGNQSIQRPVLLAFLLLLLSPAGALAKDAKPVRACASDQAGPYGTVALLSRKASVSEADFYQYWRDIHGVLATRIPGFWTYRQYHIGAEVSALRRIPKGYNKGIEPLDGFADVSFCTSEDIAGLATSKEAELIKHDEQNLFANSYLYASAAGDSLTLLREAPFATLAAANVGESLVMLVAKAAEESSTEFKSGLLAALKALPERCAVQRLRLNLFQKYNAEAWSAPGVNHRPVQEYDASIEFLFADHHEALSCLSNSSVFSASASGIAGQRLQVLYTVARRYAMVAGGRISLLGLRGLPAVELMARMGATNQQSHAVLKVVYGRGE